MEFHDYMTAYQWARKNIPRNSHPKKWSVQEFYSGNDWIACAVYSQLFKMRTRDTRLAAEEEWYSAKRPYYNVYPAIIPLLTCLNLDIPLSSLRVPFSSMLLRFPCEEREGVCSTLESVLLHCCENAKMLHVVGDMDEQRGRGVLSATIPVNILAPTELDYCGGVFTASPDTTYEDYLEFIKLNGRDYHTSKVNPLELIKLILTICMLGNDHSIIQPDVLSKDREAWEATGDWKYVERARRRGKNGWEIGRNIEERIAQEIEQETKKHGSVSPHWRNGGPALYWTGKGGKIPEIHWRNGCVVNREKLITMPTGHLDEN